MELAEAKTRALAKLSSDSLLSCEKIIPEYKKINALYGVYDEEVKTSYGNLMVAFRNEFYRCKALVDAATTIEEVNAITPTWPTL